MRNLPSSFSRHLILGLAGFLLLACLPLAEAQPRRHRPPPRYLQLSPPDQAAGREVLDSLRTQSLDGDYYLEFHLRVMPRRGQERWVEGRLWGTQNTAGPLTRLTLLDSDGAEKLRLLVQSGPHPQAWQWTEDTGSVAIGRNALFVPLAGTDLSAFDLQMPFIYWSEFIFEGLTRVRGRPAHTFLLYPPDDLAATRPDLHGVRIHLDAQFNALVQAEQIGANDVVLRSMSVVELRKIGDHWMVKSIDLREESTRNKTRFQVRRAGLGLALPRALFEPAALIHPARPPLESRITDLDT